MTKIYEASVYSRDVAWRNFKGEDKTRTLYFALDPLQLMQIMAEFQPKKSKSNNPALRGKEQPIDEGQQLKMVRDLAIQSAGNPSDDGESWYSDENFENELYGKAFLTKLASSDGDRREFSEKVILDPFRAFVGYAIDDASNTDKDKQQFSQMLTQMETIFSMPEPAEETMDEKRARLAAELAAMNEGQQVAPNVTALPSN